MARRYGLRLLEADFDELVQELYYRLLTSRRRHFGGRTEDELWRYLGHVSRSLIVDHQRSKATTKRRSETDSDCQQVAEQGLESSNPTPEEQLLDKERRTVFFRRCIEVVRGDRVLLELQALGLALLEGWPSRDIADRLQGGLSAGQVDCLVHRLRRHLAKEGIEVPRRHCVSVSA